MENVLRGLEQQPQKQSEHEQLGEAKARKKSGLGERNEAKPKRPLTGDGGTVKADTTKQAGYYSALNSSLTAVAPPKLTSYPLASSSYLGTAPCRAPSQLLKYACL